MKNALGNPARGAAFYPRIKEINKIYRTLEGGTHIYLEAPRRVGKTSILKFLEESPDENYHFIYIITESIENKNNFFKTIFEEILQSDVIANRKKMSHAFGTFISDLLRSVKSIKGVEFREGEEDDYYQLLIKLFEKTEDVKIVLMIDEFPQTIQNILDKEGIDAARHFVQVNRELRHHRSVEGKINFIYTGSVSLTPLVEKISSLTAINDLRSIEIPPLTKEQAIDFIQKLMEQTGFALSEELINYILKKIRWLIPFHLQLVQQEVVDVMETFDGTINQAGIDQAFEQVAHARNKPQFEPYFERLNKLFKGNVHDYALEILKQVAITDVVDQLVLQDLATRFKVKEWKSVTDSLVADGYIYITGKQYRYTSPVLQLWCKKHICDGN